jgi:hypothetical protein
MEDAQARMNRFKAGLDTLIKETEIGLSITLTDLQASKPENDPAN